MFSYLCEDGVSEVVLKKIKYRLKINVEWGIDKGMWSRSQGVVAGGILGHWNEIKKKNKAKSPKSCAYRDLNL